MSIFPQGFRSNTMPKQGNPFLTMSCLTALIWCSILVPKAVMQEREIKTDRMPPVVVDKDKKPIDDDLAPQVSQIDINGPVGSGQFGNTVTVLSNGNFVVTDPGYDITSPSLISNVGAVYLYDGETLEVISQLTGSTAADSIGSSSSDITVLANGNFVVRSQNWDNGTAANAGAVTFCQRDTGCAGPISASNSLVGSTTNDNVGGVQLIGNDYLVSTSSWDNGSVVNLGAVTRCSGTTGCSGVISPANSAVGNSANDSIGSLTVLSNGNYVIRAGAWDSGSTINVGAVRWCSGTGSCIGALTGANSLIGSQAQDNVGERIYPLPNGNYLIGSPDWDNGAAARAGAITFASGTGPITGIVSSTNSLVGGAANDEFGEFSFPNQTIVLPSGNVLFLSRDSGSSDTGSLTWISGTTGRTGVVSSSNSIVGSTAGDFVDSFVSVLPVNGNYLLRTSLWGSTNFGAVTWGSGTSGRSGTISATLSAVGSTADDEFGITTVPLSNGNYVIGTWVWGASDLGAARWCSGTSGCTGASSAANSLVGTVAGDGVGASSVTALTNGNYLVGSGGWGSTNVGALTWCNGTTGRTGTVSAANSLIGTNADDFVGYAIPLANGNYLAISQEWGATNVGAVTLGNGATGTTGTISAANSLLGGAQNDFIQSSVTQFPNGNFVLQTPWWNAQRGAVTFFSGTTGVVGTIGTSTSLIGSAAGDFIGGSGSVYELGNGLFAISSSSWRNGSAARAGALTYGSTTSGITGEISTANSLVGTATDSFMGAPRSLGNGNFVVQNPNWTDGSGTLKGAVTFLPIANLPVGPISTSNSLIGSTADDRVGQDIRILSNGNYIVSSTNWDNGSIQNAGALTFGDGTSGIVGAVSETNSLIGSSMSDVIGNAQVQANGNILSNNGNWDNGTTMNAGIVLYLPAKQPFPTGTVGDAESVRGSVASGISSAVFEPVFERVLVGMRNLNKVVSFRPTISASISGDWSSANTWNYGAFTQPHDVLIPNGRTVTLDANVLGPGGSVTVNSGATLTLNADRSSATPITINGILDISLGKLDMGANLLTVGCNGLVNGAGATKYVLGSTRKDFCTTGSFTYPTGTANGYSPVTADVTALTTNPSGLTVSATQTPQHLLDQTNSLKRYWTLTESGDLTANLTFNYLDPTDILGSESSYRLFRVANGNLTGVTAFLNAGSNTILTNGVTSFSDWAVGNLIPLATISGRVLNAEGRGVRNATVTMTDPLNVTRQAITGPFGAYQFTNVPTDVQYTFGVTSRRFTFTPQGLRVMNNFGGLNFVSSP